VPSPNEYSVSADCVGQVIYISADVEVRSNLRYSGFSNRATHDASLSPRLVACVLVSGQSVEKSLPAQIAHGWSTIQGEELSKTSPSSAAIFRVPVEIGLMLEVH